MLSAALLLFANTLLFSLRLSGGGSFPKPLSAAEEQAYLRRCARGTRPPGMCSSSEISAWWPISSKNTTPRAPTRRT